MSNKNKMIRRKQRVKINKINIWNQKIKIFIRSQWRNMKNILNKAIKTSYLPFSPKGLPRKDFPTSGECYSCSRSIFKQLSYQEYSLWGYQPQMSTKVQDLWFSLSYTLLMSLFTGGRVFCSSFGFHSLYLRNTQNLQCAITTMCLATYMTI